MDPRIGDRSATSGPDRIARADRPTVLDQRDRGGGVARDRIVERPELLIVRQLVAVAVHASRTHPLRVRRAEPDQRADDSARTLGLAGAEVRTVQAPDDPVGVLVDDQQIEDADGVALA
jgi:hypothetical protein